jgi:hypothetical protein
MVTSSGASRRTRLFRSISLGIALLMFASGALWLHATVGKVGAAAPRTARTIFPTPTPPPNLASPHWWSGTCNINNIPKGAAYLLTTGTGVLKGLAVCSPSSSGLGGTVPVTFDGNDAQEWQCGELSLRFMDIAWGLTNYDVADAQDIANSFPFSRYPLVQKITNGTSGFYPLPGDVMQMHDYKTGPGHTGVVESASVDQYGYGTITMLSENGNLSGRETLTVSNWTVGGDGVNYTTAWLHQNPYVVTNPRNGGTFYDLWMYFHGANGVLGEPVNDYYAIGSGQEQDFTGGSIYWSPTTGTYEVQGAIHTAYEGRFYGPTGILGFPSSNEESIANGRVSYFGVPGCGFASDAAIYYTQATQAHDVRGCIYAEYQHFGGPASALGFPLSDEEPIAGGHVSYFAGGGCGLSPGSGIFDSPATGAHEVQGCIYSEYVNVTGGPGGLLGFPTSDEEGIAGGRVSYFGGGGCGSTGGSAIFYTATTGAHQVHGCIYQAYLNAGGPGSALGFPTDDEYGIPSGRESDFQHGYIIYYSANGQTVVYYTYGCGSTAVKGVHPRCPTP